MELIVNVFNWVAANWEAILATLFAIEVVAVQIVNLTPSTVDNGFLAFFHKVLVVLANIVPNAKTVPK